MTNTALQQNHRFSGAMIKLGARAGRIEFGDKSADYIDRGPVRYFARPNPTIDPAALRSRAVTVVNAQTSDGLRAAGFVRIMTGATVAVIKTGRFHPIQKWRNALNRAKSHNTFTSHRPLGPSDDWLFDADLEQQKSKHFRALPHSIVRNWPARQTILSVAWNGKVPIAGMLTLLHDHAATYQIGWSGSAGRAVNAHHLLLAQQVEKLDAMGVETLELGTIDTHNAKGLARFKIGTGAELVRLGGTWIAIGAKRG